MEQSWRVIVVLLSALIGGLVGGLARYFLDTMPARDTKLGNAHTVTTKSASKAEDTPRWCGSALLGIVAALVVPPFLKLADSSLIPKILASETKSPDVLENLMVFAGM